MTMNIKTIPQTGGGWLRPEDHENDVAILIEVKGFERDRPTQHGPKDSVLCDMTFFNTLETLQAGAPSEVREGIRIEYTVLTRDLHDHVGIGGATVSVLAKSKPKPGRQAAWVWRPVSGDVQNLVVEYANKRNAELEAALDAVPDF